MLDTKGGIDLRPGNMSLSVVVDVVDHQEAARMAKLTVARFDSPYGPREVVVPGPFRALDDVERANARSSRHFFDASTLRFFRSRLGLELIAGRFFVTSEKSPHDRRAWSVRCAMDDGAIETVGEFQEHGSWHAAIRVARRLGKGLS